MSYPQPVAGEGILWQLLCWNGIHIARGTKNSQLQSLLSPKTLIIHTRIPFPGTGSSDFGFFETSWLLYLHKLRDRCTLYQPRNTLYSEFTVINFRCTMRSSLAPQIFPTSSLSLRGRSVFLVWNNQPEHVLAEKKKVVTERETERQREQDLENPLWGANQN